MRILKHIALFFLSKTSFLLSNTSQSVSNSSLSEYKKSQLPSTTSFLVANTSKEVSNRKISVSKRLKSHSKTSETHFLTCRKTPISHKSQLLFSGNAISNIKSHFFYSGQASSSLKSLTLFCRNAIMTLFSLITILLTATFRLLKAMLDRCYSIFWFSDKKMRAYFLKTFLKKARKIGFFSKLKKFKSKRLSQISKTRLICPQSIRFIRAQMIWFSIKLFLVELYSFMFNPRDDPFALV